MESSNLRQDARRLLGRRGRRAAAALALAMALGGCGGADDIMPPLEESRCTLPPGTEFGPSHCAIVQGVARDRNGNVLRGVAVRVDSVICCLLFVYSSNSGVTRTDGSFDFVVGRTARLTPPTVPDTVTLNLLLYRDPKAAALDPPDARAPALLWFAEMGKLVPPSVVDIRFDYPE